MNRREKEVFGGVPKNEEEFNDLLCEVLGYSLRQGDPSLTNALLNKTDLEVSQTASVVGSDRKPLREAERYPDCIISDPGQNRLLFIECKWGGGFEEDDYYEELRRRVPEEEVPIIFVADTFNKKSGNIPHIPFRDICTNMKQTDTDCPAMRDKIVSKLESLGYGDLRFPTEEESRGKYIERLHEAIFENIQESLNYNIEIYRHKGQTVHKKRTYIGKADSSEYWPRVNLALAVPGRKYGGKRATKMTLVLTTRTRGDEEEHSAHIPLTEDRSLEAVTKALHENMDEIVESSIQCLNHISE